MRRCAGADYHSHRIGMALQFNICLLFVVRQKWSIIDAIFEFIKPDCHDAYTFNMIKRGLVIFFRKPFQFSTLIAFCCSL